MPSTEFAEMFNETNFTKKNEMNMIVVMGVTGSGKSYLINRLAGQNIVQEGEDLDSCTQECQMIPVEIGNSKVLLIDTPGFDDTERPDADILNEIARVLAAQYSLGFELKGIIYMHRISDIRYSGSNVKTFEIFKRICGQEALKNVLLVTSRWNDIDEAKGAARERQLRETFWAYMIARGSCIARFHGDYHSAHEMINEGKDLNETDAGSFVDHGLLRNREKYLEDIETLEDLRCRPEDGNRVMRERVEQDWWRTKDRLHAADEQRASLRRDVMKEVQGEMRDNTQRKSRGLKRFLPLIPTSLSLLGMFVGIPPGSFEMLSQFVMGIFSGDEACV
ncbi:P-loop containing nucleoside triphosphate hydrolase [Fusarium acutatum]|uniref:P-loop containing nucleoside triphosphate hydrolase n=1 Tax=Fusarium acutatum TaxID=78861 RepID=A0A8H4JFJ7_9HYPO|nr:P-loop containing nucleoside triphosphate hydrolase [Fusarium acutatum]